VKHKKLRSGFSTGACAAAAATAAWKFFQDGQLRYKLEVLFPDGKLRAMSVAGCRLSATGVAEATIIKDGGDDPDVTDGICLRVLISEIRENEIKPEDFLLDCGGQKLFLRGALGVGKVTRPGLDVLPGKWAINSGPRRMVKENLARAGYGRQPKRYMVSIYAENGEQIARKTLNPTLGVLGGISILGTSGIVVPYSHAAYIATIKVLLKGAKAAGCDVVALATGGRTQRAVSRDFPSLPELALVRIGDFIADSLKIAAEQKFSRVIVACMYGKLYKYAQGHTYTHAHTVKLSCVRLAEITREVGGGADDADRCASSRSVREALESFPADLQTAVLEFLGRRALRQFESWCPSVKVEIRLYDPTGKFIQSW
jgi:cobalt-precorrin-5B (C1)-methyltransferase